MHRLHSLLGLEIATRRRTEANLTWMHDPQGRISRAVREGTGDPIGMADVIPRGESMVAGLSGKPSVVALPDQREPVS